MDTKQLKQRILDLAIRGKLVPQDPNDEPASVLLERIRTEKEQLIAQGKLKKSKTKSSDKPHYENVPFEIPDSWEWVTLGAIGTWQAGGTPNRGVKEYYGGDIPWLKTGDLNDGYITNIPECITKLGLDKSSAKLNPKDSVLIAMYGATIGKVGILTFPATTNQACCACIEYPAVDKLYLYYFLLSHREIFISRGGGGAQPNISKEIILATQFPLPPHAEQQRIVAEVEKWFTLIDTLEENKEDLKEYIKQVKSKVLSLAISGKLVPQDPNDEPAIELLKRINPNFKPCDTSHYENVPAGWSVCKLCDIAKITAGGTPSRKIISFWDGGTIPWLKIADMTASGKYIRTASEYITEDGMKNSSAKLMRKGTLLYTIFASIGEVGILDFDATCNQAIANIDLHISEMTDYIYYYLRNLQAYMYSISKGCTQQNINQGILKSATIPLPPLAEQKRIAEQIETIFASLDTITAEL